MTNPFYDPYRVLTKIYADGAHLKIALAETDIEPLYLARTVRTVYGVLERDRYFSHCLKSSAQKTPKRSVRIVLKIALYWLTVLKKPKYMVTDTAVELVKKLGKGGMAGFVNAFLRAFDEEKIPLPAGDEGLSITSNYPLSVVKKIREAYGTRAENILFSRSAGVSVRFVRGEEKYLSLPHRDTPFPHLFCFENFARDEAFSAGDYTFQSVGSVAVASLVAPCEAMLDACAAPGGKSVLLSEKCAAVTACELHAHRVELIRSYCLRMGVKNVSAMQCDSSVFREAFENAFDGVLCDVPCSGMGTLCENPDLALKEPNLVSLNGVQSAILSNCARYVKKRGALYYSTCSLLKEENDNIVGAFLNAHGEFISEELFSPLDHMRTSYGIQFLPDTAFGAGFYVAKLKRRS